MQFTIRGQNVHVFKKIGTFLILLEGIYGSFFKLLYYIRCIPKKSCLLNKVNLGANLGKILV